MKLSTTKHLQPLKLLFMLSLALISNEASSIGQTSQSKPKITIVQLAIGTSRSPLLLDSNGHVWHLEKDKYVRFKNLEGIVKITSTMALDKNGDVYIWDESILYEYESTTSAYSEPFKHPKLHDVTQIYENDGNSIVVVKDRDILGFEFASKPFRTTKEPTGDLVHTITAVSGEPVSLGSFDSIKKVAFDVWTNWTTGDKEFEEKYSLLVLDGNGTVHGYGLSPTWQASNSDKSFKTLDLARVKDIAINQYHIVAITEDGNAHYFGGCDLFGRNSGGVLTTGGLDDMVSPIANLATIEITAGDNNGKNLFLKNDGTVWLAYAPLPKNRQKRECASDSRKDRDIDAEPLQAGKPPVIQIGRDYVMDSNHEIWILGNWSGHRYLQKFEPKFLDEK